MKEFVLTILAIGFIINLSSCSTTYSTLSFDNQSSSTVVLKYIQENGKGIEQEIRKKEDLNMMFDKRWTDDNIRNAVNSIKAIIITYNKSDTLLNVSDKNEMFQLFKDNRAEPFKDRITFKVK